MDKKNIKKNNIIDFPKKLSSIEKEIEAIVFAAAEPLDIETIESKISKKTKDGHAGPPQGSPPITLPIHIIHIEMPGRILRIARSAQG